MDNSSVSIVFSSVLRLHVWLLGKPFENPHSWRLVWLIGCGHVQNGYDGSLMGGLNGMYSYQRYFGMCVEVHSWTSTY